MPKILMDEGSRKITRTVSFRKKVLEGIKDYCDVNEKNINDVIDKMVEKFLIENAGDDDE